jgi:hypothetical protein
MRIREGRGRKMAKKKQQRAFEKVLTPGSLS